MHNSQYKHSPLRGIALTLATTFFLQQLAFAAPGLVPTQINLSTMPKISLELPESIALIDDAYVAKDSKQLIYLMQDAHTNESGQMNMAKAIDLILKQEGPKYVFTEGGEGDNSLGYLKTLSDPNIRQRVSESLLRKGLLHGTEYLSLTGDSDFVLWGVEDRDLYDRGLLMYREVSEKRQSALNYIQKINRTANVLKGKLFSEELLKFDTLKNDYEDTKINITDYFVQLTHIAKNHSVSLVNFKALNFLNKLKKLEAKIDFDSASREQNQAIKQLSAKDQKLIHASAKSNASKVQGQADKQAQAFYALLKEKTAIHINEFPNLKKYLDYREESKQLNAKSVLDELALLEVRISKTLIQNSDEQMLFTVSNNARLLKKLFELQITPSEFSAYTQNKIYYHTQIMTGFLNKKIMDFKKYYDQALLLDESVDVDVKSVEQFYELTYARDLAFMRNIKATMDQSQEDKAILVTGGYHTVNLKALLKQAHISYISITPQVLHETNHERYERILLNQINPSYNPSTEVLDKELVLRAPKSTTNQMSLMVTSPPSTISQPVLPTARLASLLDIGLEDLATLGRNPSSRMTETASSQAGELAQQRRINIQTIKDAKDVGGFAPGEEDRLLKRNNDPNASLEDLKTVERTANANQERTANLVALEIAQDSTRSEEFETNVSRMTRFDTPEDLFKYLGNTVELYLEMMGRETMQANLARIYAINKNSPSFESVLELIENDDINSLLYIRDNNEELFFKISRTGSSWRIEALTIDEYFNKHDGVDYAVQAIKTQIENIIQTWNSSEYMHDKVDGKSLIGYLTRAIKFLSEKNFNLAAGAMTAASVSINTIETSMNTSNTDEPKVAQIQTAWLQKEITTPMQSVKATILQLQAARMTIISFDERQELIQFVRDQTNLDNRPRTSIRPETIGTEVPIDVFIISGDFGQAYSLIATDLNGGSFFARAQRLQDKDDYLIYLRQNNQENFFHIEKRRDGFGDITGINVAKYVELGGVDYLAEELEEKLRLIIGVYVDNFDIYRTAMPNVTEDLNAAIEAANSGDYGLAIEKVELALTRYNSQEYARDFSAAQNPQLTPPARVRTWVEKNVNQPLQKALEFITPFKDAVRPRMTDTEIHEKYKALLTAFEDGDESYGAIADELKTAGVHWVISGKPVDDDAYVAHKQKNELVAHLLGPIDAQITSAITRLQLQRSIEGLLLSIPADSNGIILLRESTEFGEPAWEITLAASKANANSIMHAMVYDWVPSQILQGVLRSEIITKTPSEEVVQFYNRGSREFLDDGNSVIRITATGREEISALRTQVDYLVQLPENIRRLYPRVLNEDFGDENAAVDFEDPYGVTLDRLMTRSTFTSLSPLFDRLSTANISSNTHLELLLDVFKHLQPLMYGEASSTVVPVNYINTHLFDPLEQNLANASARSDVLRKALSAKSIIVDDGGESRPFHLPNLTTTIAMLKLIANSFAPIYEPAYLSPVHGDLTTDNVLVDSFYYFLNGQLNGLRLMVPNTGVMRQDPLYDFVSLASDFFGHGILAREHHRAYHYNFGTSENPDEPLRLELYLDNEATGFENTDGLTEQFSRDLLASFGSSALEGLAFADGEVSNWQSRFLFLSAIQFVNKVASLATGDGSEEASSVMYLRSATLLMSLIDMLLAGSLFEERHPEIFETWKNLLGAINLTNAEMATVADVNEVITTLNQQIADASRMTQPTELEVKKAQIKSLIGSVELIDEYRFRGSVLSQGQRGVDFGYDDIVEENVNLALQIVNADVANGVLRFTDFLDEELLTSLLSPEQLEQVNAEVASAQSLSDLSGLSDRLRETAKRKAQQSVVDAIGDESIAREFRFTASQEYPSETNFRLEDVAYENVSIALFIVGSAKSDQGILNRDALAEAASAKYIAADEQAKLQNRNDNPNATLADLYAIRDTIQAAKARATRMAESEPDWDLAQTEIESAIVSLSEGDSNAAQAYAGTQADLVVVALQNISASISKKDIANLSEEFALVARLLGPLVVGSRAERDRAKLRIARQANLLFLEVQTHVLNAQKALAARMANVVSDSLWALVFNKQARMDHYLFRATLAITGKNPQAVSPTTDRNLFNALNNIFSVRRLLDGVETKEISAPNKRKVSDVLAEASNNLKLAKEEYESSGDRAKLRRTNKALNLVQWSIRLQTAIDASARMAETQPVLRVMILDETQQKDETHKVYAETLRQLSEQIGSPIELISVDALREYYADGKETDPAKAKALIENYKPAIVLVRSNTNAFDATKNPDYQEFTKAAAQNGVKAIIRMGVGTDNIDNAATNAHGIAVIKSLGNENSVAELTIRFWLDALKHIQGGEVNAEGSDLASGANDSQPLTASPSEFRTGIDKRWPEAKRGEDFDNAQYERRADLVFAETTQGELKRLIQYADSEELSFGIFKHGGIGSLVALKLGQIQNLTEAVLDVYADSSKLIDDEASTGVIKASKETVLSADVVSLHVPAIDGLNLTVADFEGKNPKVVINTSRPETLPIDVLEHLLEKGVRVYEDVDMSPERAQLLGLHPDLYFNSAHVAATTNNAGIGVEANSLQAVIEVIRQLTGNTNSETFPVFDVSIVNDVTIQPSLARMATANRAEVVNAIRAAYRGLTRGEFLDSDTDRINFITTQLEKANQIARNYDIKEYEDDTLEILKYILELLPATASATHFITGNNDEQFASQARERILSIIYVITTAVSILSSRMGQLQYEKVWIWEEGGELKFAGGTETSQRMHEKFSTHPNTDIGPLVTFLTNTLDIWEINTDIVGRWDFAFLKPNGGYGRANINAKSITSAVLQSHPEWKGRIINANPRMALTDWVPDLVLTDNALIGKRLRLLLSELEDVIAEIDGDQKFTDVQRFIDGALQRYTRVKTLSDADDIELVVTNLNSAIGLLTQYIAANDKDVQKSNGVLAAVNIRYKTSALINIVEFANNGFRISKQALEFAVDRAIRNMSRIIVPANEKESALALQALAQASTKIRDSDTSAISDLELALISISEASRILNTTYPIDPFKALSARTVIESTKAAIKILSPRMATAIAEAEVVDESLGVEDTSLYTLVDSILTRGYVPRGDTERDLLTLFAAHVEVGKYAILQENGLYITDVSGQDGWREIRVGSQLISKFQPSEVLKAANRQNQSNSLEVDNVVNALEFSNALRESLTQGSAAINALAQKHATAFDFGFRVPVSQLFNFESIRKDDERLAAAEFLLSIMKWAARSPWGQEGRIQFHITNAELTSLPTTALKRFWSSAIENFSFISSEDLDMNSTISIPVIWMVNEEGSVPDADAVNINMAQLERGQLPLSFAQGVIVPIEAFLTIVSDEEQSITGARKQFAQATSGLGSVFESFNQHVTTPFKTMLAALMALQRGQYSIGQRLKAHMVSISQYLQSMRMANSTVRMAA